MTLLVAIGLGLAAASAFAAELPETSRDALEREKHIYVSTLRPGGGWSDPAPIWFWWSGSHVYFTTGPETWKAKRISQGSPVRIHVGDEDGPSFEGDARIVGDPVLIERLGDAYADKYWIAWLGLFRPRVSRVESGKTVAVEVTPRTE